MPLDFTLFSLIISLVWLSALTFFLWQMISHYNKLTSGVSSSSLKAILDIVLKNVDETQKGLAIVKEHCDRIEKDGVFHIQKVGLLRFNPFKETGGDQSFILCLVDGNDTGVVISALYSRSGTRWYAKQVIKGKGKEHELSDDEKKALKSAEKVT